MLISCSRRIARRHYSPHNENLERMEAVKVFYQALEFRGWIFHVIADNTFLAGVYDYMEEQIYITSKLREVKRSQFLFEILPVLKRVFLRHSTEQERLSQHYQNTTKNIRGINNSMLGTTHVPCPGSPAIVRTILQCFP